MPCRGSIAGVPKQKTPGSQRQKRAQEHAASAKRRGVGKVKGYKFDAAAIVRFLTVLKDGGTIGKAATAAGVSRECCYLRRDADPDFLKAWKAAERLGTGVLEDMALTRAKYSDTLLIFLLKARDPSTYGSTNLRGTITPTRPGDEKKEPIKYTFDFHSSAQVVEGGGG